MKYTIDRHLKEPAYLQLYKQLREDIIQKVYPFDSKLPSKRLLAEETAVSTITVEHAYALLCDEGYIDSRQRSGYFVIFRHDDGFAAPASRTIPTYVPQNGETAAFPFSVFARTMRKVISDYNMDILKKTENAGCDRLRCAIQKYLARNRGIHVDVEQIIIGSGAEYLYGLIVELLGRQRVYAIESPSYEKIEQVYAAADVQYVHLPLSSDGIESIPLASTHADVLHITPYRSYPTGITASASKRHEYIRWAAQNDRIIIEDDFESEFSVSSKPVETLFALSAQDNVIYMNTFSKSISPALRVGYLVLPKSLVAPFYEKLGFYSCTVPTFEQFVLAELLESGNFERHINRVRRQKRKSGR